MPESLYRVPHLEVEKLDPERMSMRELASYAHGWVACLRLVGAYESVYHTQVDAIAGAIIAGEDVDAKCRASLREAVANHLDKVRDLMRLHRESAARSANKWPL